MGASSVDLSAGDVVTWAYSSYGQGIPEVSESIEVTCSIIGVDAAGNPQAWAPSKAFDVKQGATAADATVAAFKAAGIEAKYDPEGAYGFYLESITSPFDESLTLGWTSPRAGTGSCSSTGKSPAWAPPRSAYVRAIRSCGITPLTAHRFLPREA